MEQVKKITHGEMVNKLAKNGEIILQEMSGPQMHLVHMAIGISGEAGELLDAIKKVAVYQKVIDRENVIEELGDLEFYMEGLRQGLEITREETIEYNMKKLAVRYGDYEYSNERAQARADKE